MLAIPAAPRAQTLRFDPSANYPTDYIFTLAIRLECNGLAVQGVEASVAFDPYLLHLDAVTPGPWLTAAALPHYLFDYSSVQPQGAIHFACALLGGTDDQDGVLAYCHFTAYDLGTSPLIFQDVDVRDGSNAALPFGHSVGDYVTLDPVIGTEQSSFGALKALFR